MKIAVVLFNLGAPDSPDAVGPFLRNLFRDPAILRVPSVVRLFLATIISYRRTSEAKKIYDKIGGSSPLLAETQRQADALMTELDRTGGDTYGVFIAMRHWHPFTAEAVQQVSEFGADRIVLLPLYPQYSTTTTASSIAAWHQAARKHKLSAPTVAVCCYPHQADWIQCQADLLNSSLSQCAEDEGSMRILFSAHGLPKRIVDGGDPYPDHVVRTATAIIDLVAKQKERPLDWVVCYQSKVGPLEWIGPSTEAEIERAGRDRKSVVVAPISFVSEHSETLVELDITFRELADSCGVGGFYRVPTAGIHPGFISGLAANVASAVARDTPVDSAPGGRICGVEMSACPCSIAQTEARL